MRCQFGPAWRAVEAFYDGIAAESDCSASIDRIVKNYGAAMQKVGPPYR